MNRNKKIEKKVELTYKKINAVGNKIRLALMGLLYIKNKSSFTDLSTEIDMDSNRLAYHLKILLDAKFIHQTGGKNYSLTEEGAQFLDDLGFIERIEDMEKSYPPPTEKKEVEHFIPIPQNHILEIIGKKPFPFTPSIPQEIVNWNEMKKRVLNRYFQGGKTKTRYTINSKAFGIRTYGENRFIKLNGKNEHRLTCICSR